MSLAVELIDGWEAALVSLADAERAVPMKAYMKHHFEFLGIPSAPRRNAARAVWRSLDRPTEADVHEVLRLAWERPEREYQYCAVDYLDAFASVCSAAGSLPVIEWTITTKPWWDTVDGLCRSGAGAIVRRDRPARAVMDEWLGADDIWLIRSAILHEERWGPEMDFEWISAAARRHAEHREFFVRKAIGWVLRTYAHRSAANAHEVRALLETASFSGLTRREALNRVRH